MSIGGFSLELKEIIELVESRADMYRFLATVYSYQPLKDIARMIKDKTFLDVIPSDEGEGFKLLRKFVIDSAKSKNLVDELEVEHTGLFVLPGDKNFRPYESVYVDPDKFLGGRVTKEVEKFYKRAGVEFTPKIDEPADYIAVEFEFLYVLCGKEAEAWRTNKKGTALAYLKVERDFIQNHLAKWVFEFCDDLLKRARLDFFKGTALITKEYVEIEKGEINHIIESAEGIKADLPGYA